MSSLFLLAEIGLYYFIVNTVFLKLQYRNTLFEANSDKELLNDKGGIELKKDHG